MQWPLYKLEDLTDSDRPITYGVVKPGPEDRENGVKFIRGGDIYDGNLAIDSLRTITPAVSRQYRRTLLAGGELVVSLVGNPGHVAVVPNSLAGANLARQAGLVALRRGIDADFVKYFLMSPRGRAEMFSQMTGSVQIVINLANLRAVRVPIPPLPIQRRIAGILSAYDELIENSQRRIRILESMTRALYREWFVHFRFPGHESVSRVPSPLGDIPKGWEVNKLFELTKVSYGKNLPTKKLTDDGAYSVYGAAKIIGRYTEYTREHRTIICGCRGSVGEMQITQPQCYVTNNSFTFDPTHPDNYFWLFHALKERGLRDVIGGAAQPQITLEGISSVELATPPLTFRTSFQQFASALFEQVWTLDSQIQNLRRTRDLLLPRLLSGQIDVEAIAA